MEFKLSDPENAVPILCTNESEKLKTWRKYVHMFESDYRIMDPGFVFLSFLVFWSKLVVATAAASGCTDHMNSLHRWQ
jgi:hypothetical protein